AASASDNVGVTSVQFQIDGVNMGSAFSAGPYSFSFDTTKYANGSHTLKAIAKDAAGNQSSASLSVSIQNSSSDTQAPTVSITAPTSGTTYTSAQTVTITASASDNVGVSKVEFYKDGSLLATDTSSPYSSSLTLSSASNGTHTLLAKAYDAAGNVGTSSSVSITVNISQTSGSGSTYYASPSGSA